MKMQKRNQFRNCQLEGWGSFLTSSEDEEESQFCLQPCVNTYNEFDDNLDEYRAPRSLLSCPPSVGPDQDAFAPTPQNMYAPFTPACCTPPNSPEGHNNLKDITLSCYEEQTHVLSGELTNHSLKSDQDDDANSSNTEPTTSPHQQESSPVYFWSEVEEQNNHLSDDNLALEKFDYVGEQEFFSTPNYSKDVHAPIGTYKENSNVLFLETGTNPQDHQSNDVRMSLDQFLQSLDISIVHAGSSSNGDHVLSQPIIATEGNNLLQLEITQTPDTGQRKRNYEEALSRKSAVCNTEYPFTVKKICIISERDQVHCGKLDLQLPCANMFHESSDRVLCVDNVITSIITSDDNEQNQCTLCSEIDLTNVEHPVITSVPAASTDIATSFDHNGNVTRSGEAGDDVIYSRSEHTDTDEGQVSVQHCHVNRWQSVNNMSLAALIEDPASTSLPCNFPNDPSLWTLPEVAVNALQLVNMTSRCDQSSPITSVAPQMVNLGSGGSFFSSDAPSYPHSCSNQSIDNVQERHQYNAQQHQHVAQQHQHVAQQHQHVAQQHQHSTRIVLEMCSSTQDFRPQQADQLSSDFLSACSTQLEDQLPVLNTSAQSQEELDTFNAQQCVIQRPVFSVANRSDICHQPVDEPQRPVTHGPENGSTSHFEFIAKDVGNKFLSTDNFSEQVNMKTEHSVRDCAQTSCDNTHNLSYDNFHSSNGLNNVCYGGTNLITCFREEAVAGSYTPQHLNHLNHKRPFSNGSINDIIITDESNDDTRHVFMATPHSANLHDISLTSDNENVFNWSHNQENNLMFADANIPKVDVYTTDTLDREISTRHHYGHVESDEVYGSNEQEVVSTSFSTESVDNSSIRGFQTVGTTCSPDLPTNADPALIDARMTSAETSDVKNVLKLAIISKRIKEGKGQIDVSFKPSPRAELTEEENEKKCHTKLLNRIAASTHRQKVKTNKQAREQELEELTARNRDLNQKCGLLEQNKAVLCALLVSRGITQDSLRSLLSHCAPSVT